MEIRDVSAVLKRMSYFTDILVPEYEKKFNTSLENIYFWDPFNIEEYPEEVETAISKLEKAIADNRDFLEEDNEEIGEKLRVPESNVVY